MRIKDYPNEIKASEDDKLLIDGENGTRSIDVENIIPKKLSELENDKGFIDDKSASIFDDADMWQAYISSIDVYSAFLISETKGDTVYTNGRGATNVKGVRSLIFSGHYWNKYDVDGELYGGHVIVTTDPESWEKNDTYGLIAPSKANKMTTPRGNIVYILWMEGSWNLDTGYNVECFINGQYRVIRARTCFIGSPESRRWVCNLADFYLFKNTKKSRLLYDSDRAFRPNYYLIRTATNANVDWNAFDPAVLEPIFGKNWYKTVGYYQAQNLTASYDTSGLLSSIGMVGTYMALFNVYNSSGYMTIMLIDSSCDIPYFCSYTSTFKAGTPVDLKKLFKPMGEITDEKFNKLEKRVQALESIIANMKG